MRSSVDCASERARNLAELVKLGFRVAPSLPLGDDDRSLRPMDELARRLFALNAVFLYVAAYGEDVSNGEIEDYRERNRLDDMLTAEEREMLSLRRAAARAEHAHGIGWRLENMWALAWVLGFDPPPPIVGGMIRREAIDALCSGWLQFTALDAVNVARSPRVRSEAEVIRLEDLFYCAHNAVRSAQLGAPTVPDDFDPIADGGTVHERRHALTWALSPGVDWIDTDLST